MDRGRGSRRAGSRGAARGGDRIRRLSRRATPLALLVALLAGCATGRPIAASPFLATDHWVHDALLRIGPPGELASTRGRRTITWCDAIRALDAVAAETGPRADRAEAALSRLKSELPVTGDAECEVRRFEVSPLGGIYERTGTLLTGAGIGPEDPGWEPPRPDDEPSSFALGARLTAGFGRRVAAIIEPGHFAGDLRIETAQAVLAGGPLLIWAGRRPVGYGPGAGGGVVFGDDAVVEGAGFQLAAPVTGPGFLRHLGPIHFETLLARGGRSGTVEDPWLWAARGSIRPHPRLSLAVNRGALFGGEGNVGVTLRDIVYILIGKHAGGGSSLENQIVAVELVYSPPLPVATEAYIEWGLEDSAGAWRNVPGVLWGVAVTDLPGLGGVRVGLENADFARSCCGNPPWYRHMFLSAGWTEDRRPLGHPLGGHGEEWRVFGSGSALDQRLQLRGSIALRDRWSENLYAPDRAGESQAARLLATYLADGWDLGVELYTESGEDWGETLFSVLARLGF